MLQPSSNKWFGTPQITVLCKCFALCILFIVIFFGKLSVRTLRRIRKNFPLTKEVTRLSAKASFASLSLSCNPHPPPYLVHCVSDTDKASQITRNQLNIFTLFICVPITRYDCVLDYTGHPEIARISPLLKGWFFK